MSPIGFDAFRLVGVAQQKVSLGQLRLAVSIDWIGPDLRSDLDRPSSKINRRGNIASLAE
jgi:hypothetical protein